MNLLTVWILNFMACSLFYTILEFFHNMTHPFVKSFNCCARVMCLATPIGSFIDPEEQKEEALSHDECKSCKNKISLRDEGVSSSEDAEVVMERLGIWSKEEELGSWYVGKCKGCRLLNGASLLLEEKEASLEELEAAFAVFDENGDGLISAKELRSVMGRLGFKEGMRLEDCRMMIRAYDEDGDGRISFDEFKNMLENAR